MVEVRGCFWHLHQECRNAALPTTRWEWWEAKLQGNVERDARNNAALEAAGWRVQVVWECELHNPSKIEMCLREFLGPPGRTA